MDKAYRVKLSDFEGPLDLLLFFIFQELEGTFTSLEIEPRLELFFRLIDSVVDFLKINLRNDIEGG